MTYAVSYALQAALFATLSADTSLNSLVGGNIFDATPSGTAPDLYVLIGDETVRDRSSKTHSAAYHDVVIRVVSDAAGFSTAKQVAAAVCDALIDASIPLNRGSLVGIRFVRARAVRGDSPGIRQIDLTFRAHVADG